jgi:hypothetical protein
MCVCVCVCVRERERERYMAAVNTKQDMRQSFDLKEGQTSLDLPKHILLNFAHLTIIGDDISIKSSNVKINILTSMTFAI